MWIIGGLVAGWAPWLEYWARAPRAPQSRHLWHVDARSGGGDGRSADSTLL